METIISPVNKNLILKELTAEKLLRPTNKAHNEVYIVTAHNAPNTMREIGRLRELSFRTAGGGSGKALDVDQYDFLPDPYQQLIVWDPSVDCIIGGYRFISGKQVELETNGQPKFTMSHLFNFSDKFIDEYRQHTIELGRAFVQPDYQTARMGLKSMFALDNLWDGLGALILLMKDVKYFIGKITIYNDYPEVARELIYNYMKKHFVDSEKLIYPHNHIIENPEITEQSLSLFTNEKAATDYKILQKAVAAEGVHVPPLFNAYIGLSDTLRMFGTAQDKDFGNTYETGIMLTISDLSEIKRKRYIEPYKEYLRLLLSELSIHRNRMPGFKKIRRKARVSIG